MAEEQPSLHIDTDWKKQAQAEKKRLAEEAAKNRPPVAPAAPSATASGQATTAAGGGTTAAAVPSRKRGGRGEIPPASFTSLVQAIMTQILYYLGEMTTAGGQTVLDLDLAKNQLDTLGVVEEKTKGNLTPDEQRVLDSVLYETRMRFVRVASEFLGP